FLDTVTFDPSAVFRAQDLNTIRTNNSEVSVFGKDNRLPPRNICQHLYKLTPLGPLQTSRGVSLCTGGADGELLGMRTERKLVRM
ncbi:hypothetical protein GBAR_LOCUS9420, partial [Geodia barretti]